MRLRLPSARRGGFVALLAAATLFGACGDAGSPQAGAPPAATSPAAGAPPGASTPDAKRAASAGTFGKLLDLAQIATFERANVKLVNLTNATDDPLDRRILQAKAACGRLDPKQPMLAAFARQCAPTIQIGKLQAIADERCDGSKGPGPCARLLGRLGRSFTALAAANRSYKLAAKRATGDSDCLRTLLPSARSVRARRSAGRYATAAGAAVTAGDEAAFKRELRKFAGTLRSTDDHPGRGQPIIDAIRGACGLPKTQSPPGERSGTATRP